MKKIHAYGSNQVKKGTSEGPMIRDCENLLTTKQSSDTFPITWSLTSLELVLI